MSGWWWRRREKEEEATMRRNMFGVVSASHTLFGVPGDSQMEVVGR